MTVEVDVTLGIGIHLCGLGDAAVKESIIRLLAVLQAKQFRVPGRKIIINLAPADLHKSGSGYDLPITIGVLAASEQIVIRNLDRFLIMGELGLDGSVRNISGALPIADMAAKSGYKACILPYESALEAAFISDITVYGVRTIDDVLMILEDTDGCEQFIIRPEDDSKTRDSSPEVDFADIIGQQGAKRGVEIAAAGGHNLIFVGSPGSGKSSLAKAMAGILPPMSKEESLLTSKIYSVAGVGDSRLGLVRQRPFRSPHCSASMAAMIGGGGGENVLPGEVSLAQGGVLFLDEVSLISRSVLESLRAPLEDRKVVISRLKTKVEFPASFTLVAASNPCPCGYYGEGDRCRCTPTQRAGYLSRLSGPLLDRIDLQIWVHAVPPGKIVSSRKAEPSSEVAARVARARSIQARRFAFEPISCNAEMSNRQIEKYCPLSEDCRRALEGLLERMSLSMRAYFRIIRVARTIADLEGAEKILPQHLMEAAGYRFLDKPTV